MKLSKPLLKSGIAKKTTRRKYYLTLLLAFSLLTFVIVITTSLIFANIFVKDVRDQLYTDYKSNLKRLGNDFDSIFTQLAQVSVYLKQNSDINSYLTSNQYDIANTPRADIFLSTIKNLNPYVDSIILYNKKRDFVLSIGNQLQTNRRSLSIDHFIKDPPTGFDTKSELNMVLTFLDIGSIQNNRNVKTISLIFSDSSFETGYDNAVIMTMDPAQISKMLSDKVDGVTMITDGSGFVIFSSDTAEPEDTLADKSYFQKIIQSKTSEGLYTIQANRTHQIVTFAKSYNSDFYIINIRSLQSYTTITREKLATILLICLVMIAVFIFTSFILSKSVYSPIKKVTDLFVQSGYLNVISEKGELDTISVVYQDTLKHVSELEDLSKEKNNRLKEEYLRLLLKTNALPEEITTEIQNYDISLEFDNLIHVALSIDTAHSISADRILVYETTLCKIIPDLIQSDFMCETVRFFNGEIALLLNFKNKLQNDFNTLLTHMEKIRNAARSLHGISLTIGIGGAASKMEDCASAYSKALDMVKHRFVLGYNMVIYEILLQNLLTSNCAYPNELEDQLISAIKTNNKELYDENLQKLFDLLKFYPYSEATSVIFQVITACLKNFNQITTQDNYKSYIKLDQISNIFSDLDTLEQVKAWLSSLFEDYRQIINGIRQLKDNKHYSQILKAKAYIDEHYDNPNLSAEFIAEIIGYSPYYFTKLFKMVTGVNIVDYIRHVRIERVKVLLASSDCKINEIPGMAGFCNVSHFYSIFKKDVGLTPSEYRKYKLS